LSNFALIRPLVVILWFVIVVGAQSATSR